jgi:putative transposase
MARAQRHFLPGYLWHITHRCHKREFLLKFKKDRDRYVWHLYRAKRRFGLSVLNYMVTCNHVHLLVGDNDNSQAIPKFMQLVAGRVAQEYNRRKTRNGAFWDDRYHATAIEKNEHFLRCMIYIDLNMVRAGVADHPIDWTHSGYYEIQNPRHRYRIIDSERLKIALGIDNSETLGVFLKRWVGEVLVNEKRLRDEMWTEGIAVGSRTFVENIKAKLSNRVIGRKIVQTGGQSVLREPRAAYKVVFGLEKDVISSEKSVVFDNKVL